jgi:hypothetical protein
MVELTVLCSLDEEKKLSPYFLSFRLGALYVVCFIASEQLMGDGLWKEDG